MIALLVLVVLLVIIVAVCVAMLKGDGGANNSTYSSARIRRIKPVLTKRPVTVAPIKVEVSVSTGDDEPPRPAVFSSPAIKVLVEEYRGEYHRDYPFLDPDYSPGSHMRFMDLTRKLVNGSPPGTSSRCTNFGVLSATSGMRSPCARSCAYPCQRDLRFPTSQEMKCGQSMR